MLRFEWDEKKNKSNRSKHGVWFEEAQSVFNDPHARFFADEEHSHDEDRFIALGMTTRVLTGVNSARNATRRERKTYEEGV